MRNPFSRRPNDTTRRPADFRPPHGLRLVPNDDVRPLGDPEVARVATIQRGGIHTRQLRAAGLSKDVISDRAQGGLLHEVFHTVYLVGHEDESELARETCALLAVGDDALLARDTAGWMWRWRARPADVHVVVEGRQPRSRDGLVAHTTARIDPRDRRVLHGLPITSPARTLVDLALPLAVHELERALAEAIALRQLRIGDVEAAIERAVDRRGLKKLVAAIDGGPQLTRSTAEAMLLELIAAAGLPRPDRTNHRIGPWEVDAAYLRERLVIEVDGYAFHSSPWAFERDRRKTAWLEGHGWRVLRVTHRQLTREPAFVVATLAQALADRRHSGKA